MPYYTTYTLLLYSHCKLIADDVYTRWSERIDLKHIRIELDIFAVGKIDQNVKRNSCIPQPITIVTSTLYAQIIFFFENITTFEIYVIIEW